MSPQNWLCRSERKPALDTQAPNSPLVHINRDNAYSPPHTRYETHGDIQSSIPTTATCLSSKMQKNTIPHTSDNTRCFLNISWRHFVSILTSLNSTSLAVPKANPIFHAANKKKTFFVVLLKKSVRHSFVLPKKYSVREINNFPKRYIYIYIYNFQLANWCNE